MRNYLLLGFLFMSALLGCKKNDVQTPNAPDATVSTTIVGIVTDENGQLLQGVELNLGGSRIFSDKEGGFVFENVQVPIFRFYIKASLNNYFESGYGGYPVENGVVNVQLKLMKMGIAQNVNGASGGTTNFNGAKIKFDENSFTTSNGTPYNGVVNVYARPLNPDNPGFSELIPGADLIARTPEVNFATLESYGMVGVELRDANNNELKLARGKMAEVRFPIATSQLSSAPAEIPLLSLDPQTGEWIQEGFAQKQGNEYVGMVGHFSWWNCDIARFNCRIKGRVVDCAGRPLSCVSVIVNGQYCRITDADGYYQGWVPRIPLTFQVVILGLPQTLANTVTLSSPNFGLNVLPDIRVGALGNCPTYVVGKINRCTGDRPYYIRAIWGDNPYLGTCPQLIGSDSFRLLIPANRTLTIRISSGLFVRDTIIGNVLNGQTIDIGSINGCPTIPAVVSDSIQAISQTTARCRGFVTGSGGSAVTERGFVWSTSPNPTIDLPTKLAIGSGLGLFEGDINGLSANTTYYARAYAKNNSGVAYGAEIIFQTFSDGIFVTTTLNDQMPSPFVCGGVVESSVVSITERGILYGVSQNLDYNSSQLVGSFQYGASYGGAVPTPGSGGAVPSSGNECGRITSQSGTGSFTVNIMYLFGDVQYYFCAYAKTSSGQVVKGEVRPVPIRSFARSSVEPGRANVFWSPNFNLFDLLTDELIVPENGVYKFYYSSNEDPEVYYKEMPAAELPNFLFYKFKTEANCFKWTQIKKGLLQP